MVDAGPVAPHDHELLAVARAEQPTRSQHGRAFAHGWAERPSHTAQDLALEAALPEERDGARRVAHRRVHQQQAAPRLQMGAGLHAYSVDHGSPVAAAIKRRGRAVSRQRISCGWHVRRVACDQVEAQPIQRIDQIAAADAYGAAIQTGVDQRHEDGPTRDVDCQDGACACTRRHDRKPPRAAA